MTRYAVMGDPIAQSKSPQIHSQFANLTKQNVAYEKLRVEAHEFPARVNAFFNGGGGGLNVTVPHKEDAFALADTASPRAALARAANTLGMDVAGKLWADNTDGIGLVRDLENNNHCTIKDKNILILGAGGAARGAMAELIHRQPASLTIMNRTTSRADALRDDFTGEFPIGVRELNQPNTVLFDLVINATSMGLQNQTLELSSELFAAKFTAYDMMYGATDTAFMLWAKSIKADLVLDGLGMLVEQAAESFALWRGVRPHTKDVILKLRNEL